LYGGTDLETTPPVPPLRDGLSLMSHWNVYLEMAAKKRLSHVRLLTHIIEQEYQIKQTSACTHRLKRARIPEPLEIETYPFGQQPKLNRKIVMTLYDSLDYITANPHFSYVFSIKSWRNGLSTFNIYS
jgi:hypothetical protein